MKALIVVSEDTVVEGINIVSQKINSLLNKDYDLFVLAKDKNTETYPNIDDSKFNLTVLMGNKTEPFSAFADEDTNETNLRDALVGMDEIHVAGMDYQGRLSATVLDALTAFHLRQPTICVVEDATIGEDIEEHEENLYDLSKHGAKMVSA